MSFTGVCVHLPFGAEKLAKKNPNANRNVSQPGRGQSKAQAALQTRTRRPQQSRENKKVKRVEQELRQLWKKLRANRSLCGSKDDGRIFLGTTATSERKELSQQL